MATMQFLYYFSNYGPLTGCDPDANLTSAYALATGQCFNSTYSQDVEGNVDKDATTNEYLKMTLPENLAPSKIDTFNNAIVSSLIGQTDDRRAAQKEQLVNKEKSTNKITDYTRTNQYFPIVFVPSAIGMKAGMLLGKSSWGILQLARIANFVFYLAIMVISLIIVPRGRVALAAIGLLPHSVFIASSIMYDSVVIALCTLYVCIALNFLFTNKEMKKRDMIVVATLTLLIMLSKAPYAGLALLFIFMPKQIWKTKEKLLTCSITLVIFCIIYFCWSKYFQLIYTTPDVDYSVQLNYFQHHAIFVIFNCFVNSLTLLTIHMPAEFLQLFILIVLIVTSIIFRYRQKMDLYVALSILAAVLLLVCTFLFEFLTWNNYQGISPHYLEGFQERYLLPLLPLLLVMCQEPRMEHSGDLTKTSRASSC